MDQTVRTGLIGALASAASLLVGCGGAPPAADGPPHLPDLIYYGGPILQAPRVVPIFWAQDPDQANIVGFDNWLLSSQTWVDMEGEYTDSQGNHIGAGSVTAPIVLDDPPASVTDQSLKKMVDDGISKNGWLKPDENTIYTFYLNPNTSIPGGCSAFGGYHNISNHGFYYAVIVRCGGDLPNLSQATVVSTHEIGEASTDPNPPTGWSFSPFNISNEGEDGDLCAWQLAQPDGQHVIQRMFSNKANEAGHDPCVPAPAGQSYANVVSNPVAFDVSISGGPSTITIQPFTDGPVSGPLKIDFYAAGLTFDGPTAIEAGSGPVTYQVTAQPGSGGYQPVMILTSQQGGATSFAYGAAKVSQ
jgi:hypothetical protein